MIDKVIICGVRRANELVPEIEIRQMLGRSGRSYDVGDKGEAFVIVPEADVASAERYLYGEPPAIESQMDVLDNLAFHILPSVYARDVYDDITADQWFKSSFACLQGKALDFNKLFSYLVGLQMIAGDNKQFYITELGKVSCKFYLRPDRVYMLREKFEELKADRLLENDFAISWAFASQDIKYYVDNEMYETYVSSVRSLGLRFNGDEKDGLAYYGIIGLYKSKQLKYVMNEYEDDMPRLLNAVKYISNMEKWNIDNNLEVMMKMFAKRVKYKDAKIMIENNIHSKSHLRKILGEESYE